MAERDDISSIDALDWLAVVGVAKERHGSYPCGCLRWHLLHAIVHELCALTVERTISTL